MNHEHGSRPRAAELEPGGTHPPIPSERQPLHDTLERRERRRVVGGRRGSHGFARNRSDRECQTELQRVDAARQWRIRAGLRSVAGERRPPAPIGFARLDSLPKWSAPRPRDQRVVYLPEHSIKTE